MDINEREIVDVVKWSCRLLCWEADRQVLIGSYFKYTQAESDGSELWAN